MKLDTCHVYEVKMCKTQFVWSVIQALLSYVVLNFVSEWRNRNISYWYILWEISFKNLKTCLWTCQLCSLICQRPYVDVNHYCCWFFSNHILLISVAVYVLINYCCILGYPPRLSKLWWVCRLCLYQNANIDVTRMK